MTCFKTLAAAAMLALAAGTASAATITFGNYASSNVGDSLSPLVTVSDEVAGGFLVTVTHVAPSNGSLNLVAFDLGTAVFTSGNVTNVRDNGAAMTLASPCPGGQGPAVGSYCFGTSVPLGGNSNTLNPFDSTPFDVVLAFNNQDGVGRLGAPLTFQISNLGGTLTLDSFRSVGLRFQDANNDAGSDKLVGTPVGTPSVVPLPAAAWLLVGGLAGLAALGRTRRAA
jgi:hypothetical protein